MAGKATTEGPEKRGRGRPRKGIDPARVEPEALIRNLAYVGATVEQIAFVTGLSKRTLETKYCALIKNGKGTLSVRLRATLVGHALACEPGDRAGASLLMFACKTLAGLIEGMPLGGEDDRPKGAIIDVTGDEDDDATGDATAAPN